MIISKDLNKDKEAYPNPYVNKKHKKKKDNRMFRSYKPDVLKVQLQEYTFHWWLGGQFRYRLKQYGQKYGTDSMHYKALEECGNTICQMFKTLSIIRSKTKFKNYHHGITYAVNLWKSIPMTKEKDLPDLVMFFNMHVDTTNRYFKTPIPSTE